MIPITEWNSYLVSGSDPSTNQVQSTNASGASATLTYDAAGNITYDGSNSYLYDVDGRQYAVSHTVAGVTTYTGYVYDAEGNRVAKGTLVSFSCTATLTVTNTYILDQSNQQITETDGSGNWVHSNVFAAGSLIATYDYKSDGTNPLSFNLSDWLGTKRVVTDYEGTTTEKWSSLPFGDGLSQLYGSTSDTEHHFTGKERDTESGNDYFMARYYANNMGRFITPDWAAKAEPVPYAKMDDPQSLNLYAYVLNNPILATDTYGHGGAPPMAYLLRNQTKAEIERDNRAFHDHPVRELIKQGVLPVAGLGAYFTAGLFGAPALYGTTFAQGLVLATPIGSALLQARDTVTQALGKIGEAAEAGSVQLPGGTANLLNKAETAVAEHMTDSDIAGAIKQSYTGMQSGGDHLQEVGSVANSLSNLSDRFNTALKNPNLPQETRDLYTNAVNAMKPAIDKIKNLQ